jgi:hypothetical protein
VWLLKVTGNRPCHVLGAKVQKVYPSSVLLRWGPRKVRGPSLSVLRYECSWSSQPPADVLKRWAGLGKEPWLFMGSSNIAAACNVWMTKRGTGNPPILRSSTAQDDLMCAENVAMMLWRMMSAAAYGLKGTVG